MKLNEKMEAIRLRKLGKSYGEIRKKVKVSKGTLSLWLRDVKLTPTQEKRLYVTLRRRNAYKGAKVRQEKRIERTKQTMTEARKEAKRLLKNPLFLAGSMLYWAEGTKRYEQVNFSNSDPSMIKFMMLWFRKICKVPENKFRIGLHIHKLHCRKNIEKYWSKLTDIPLSQFQKTQIKPTSLKHRKNQLYDGTCVIRISSSELFRKIEGWRLEIISRFKT